MSYNQDDEQEDRALEDAGTKVICWEAATTERSERSGQLRVRMITVTFELGIPLDLPQLAMQAPNAELVGHRLELKSLRPPWKAAVRGNGHVKLQMSGGSAEARLAGKKLARMVRRVHCAAATFKHFRVLEWQLDANLPSRLDIHAASQEMRASPNFRFLRESRRGRGFFLEVKDSGVQVLVNESGLLNVCKTSEISSAVDALKALVAPLRCCAMWW